MEYIDKSSHRDKGIKITENYLKAIWIQKEQRYPVDYYGSFRSLPNKQNCFYKQMTKVLLDNQHNHCCYCMRRLTGDGDTTLEHIVPQASDNDMLQEYQKHKDEFPMFSEDLLKLSSVFSKEANPSLPPYPHTVSYDNLVASCYGLFPKIKNDEVVDDKSGHCCNNVRSSDIVFPLYFLPNVSSLFVFCANGSILDKEDSVWSSYVRSVISSARLNWQTLVDIRQLWYVLKDVSIDEVNACKDDSIKRFDLLQDNLYLTDIDQGRVDDLINKFQKDSYWDCFLLYDWFHNIIWN